MKRSPILWIAGALVFLLILRVTLFSPKPDDQKMIQTALQESLQASREGRSGGVLDIISKKFQVNGQSPGSRWDIAKFIRESKPDIEVQNVQAIVSGDRATLTTPVRVKTNILTREFDETLPGVTMIFEREPARRWLVIPSSTWRLTDVVLPEGGIPAEFQGSMGESL